MSGGSADALANGNGAPHTSPSETEVQEGSDGVRTPLHIAPLALGQEGRPATGASERSPTDPASPASGTLQCLMRLCVLTEAPCSP